jgi:DNA-binding MarR family transcriptional regulator
LEELYKQTYEKLMRLQSLIHRHSIYGGGGAHANRACGQGRVLAMLKMRPDISTKDLAYVMGIRQQSLNELLTKLERKGYITRTQSEADKRVILIGLTEEGKAVEQADFDDDVLSVFSEEELKTLDEFIDRLIESLDEKLRLAQDEDECGDLIHIGRGEGKGKCFGKGKGMAMGEGLEHCHGKGAAHGHHAGMGREKGCCPHEEGEHAHERGQGRKSCDKHDQAEGHDHAEGHEHCHGKGSGRGRFESGKGRRCRNKG